jgi:hypothetical protein
MKPSWRALSWAGLKRIWGGCIRQFKAQKPGCRKVEWEFAASAA